jgi:hypothetical protein
MHQARSCFDAGEPMLRDLGEIEGLCELLGQRCLLHAALDEGPAACTP